MSTLTRLKVKGALVALGVVGLFMVPTRGPRSAQASAPTGVPVRLAYFPNLTHAPALVGVGRGTFARAVAGRGRLEAKVFNAGPEAMEALLAGEVDVVYVGPGPALNTFVKTRGAGLRVVAGACVGGAALVARRGVAISGLDDLAGKRVAVPQLGGTQDIACRHFLGERGLKPVEQGGTVSLLSVKNPDILALFKQGQLDAAWVPEPWAARLVAETGARLVLDERDLWPGRRFVSTVVVARSEFARQHADLLRSLLLAHRETVAWLTAHPADARAAVNAELARLAGKPLPAAVLEAAWERVGFTAEPDRDKLEAVARSSAQLGYLKLGGVDLSALVDTRALEAK